MPQTLLQLQIVRAAAAVVVVLFHAQWELHHRGFVDPFPDLTIGAFGVDLFFVVSGFIMVHASERLFGRPAAALPFLARRAVRIVPLYWTFTLAFALVAVRLGQSPGHAEASPTHVAGSFLFLPAVRPEDGARLPVYALGWTLEYEMFFYCCFAMVIGLRRTPAVAVLSAALCALVLAGRVMDLPQPLAYWSNPLILEFVFGLWLGLAHGAGWRLLPLVGVPLSVAALIGVYLAVPLADPVGNWRGLVWGVPAAVLVAQAVGLRAPGISLPARAAIRLGDASYSLYLVHSALFLAVFEVLSHTGGAHRLSAFGYASILVIGSVAAALLLFRTFERPVTRRLQRTADRLWSRGGPEAGILTGGVAATLLTSDCRPG